MPNARNLSLLTLAALFVLGCDTRAPAPSADVVPEPPIEASASTPLGPPAGSAATAPVAVETAKAEEKPACPDGFECDYGVLERDKTREVTGIHVDKSDHVLHLLSNGVVAKTYTVALGWGGAGPKKREGDGVTPVGTYKITGRLPTSPWHILLGVSYPNYEDVKRHAKLKADREIPADSNIGFGIALHGRSASMKDGEHKKTDWTLGCIAVDNTEIEEISALVKKDTTITIVD
jgi:hypothetical protein